MPRGQERHSHHPLSGNPLRWAPYEIKLVRDSDTFNNGDAVFILSIPRDAHRLRLLEAGAYVTSAGISVVSVMVRNLTNGHDMLSVPITIDAGKYSSFSLDDPPATPPVVNDTYAYVSAADLVALDIDNNGNNAKGLGVILRFG